jgi:hypothetical protein
LLPLLAGPLEAQAAVASDLWRVAAGTLIVPAALADDGTSPLWTPAATLKDRERYRIGVEAIHAPPDVGVAGGIVAFTARTGAASAISLTYGRLGIGSVGYTETSPELTGGSLAIYNQTASLGVAHAFSRGLTGGVALRYLSGQLAFATRAQFGVDFGAQYAGLPHLRLGVTTHFFDPAFSSASQAASYSVGAEYRSSAFDLWGARGAALLRWGLTAARGDDTQQLISAGLTIGSSLSLDYGAARERTAADLVWRSRLGLGVGAGRYTVRMARDGGVNDFGATYRFGLTAVFR